MTLDELVSFFNATLDLHPPKPWLFDDMRIDTMKWAFPRPDLLDWFDDEGGSALAPRQYGIGLLLRAAMEWNRAPHANDVLLGGRATALAALAAVHRPGDIAQTIWRIENEPMPDIRRRDQLALIFGVLDDPDDAPAGAALLRLDAPNALRLLILSEPANGALAMALASASDGGPPLPGFELFRRTLQSWPDARHVALCRTPIDPGTAP